MSQFRLAGLLVAALGVALLVVGVARLLDSTPGSSTGSATGRGSGALVASLRAARSATAPFSTLTQARVVVGTRRLLVAVADSPSEREQGLRQRRDLGGYDGMLFVFPEPASVAFTMSTVPVALDIGFYDAGGRLVTRLRMEPCPGTESQCPRYRATGPFHYALETLAGGLPTGSLG